MKTRKEGMKQILSANLGVKRYDAKHTDRSTENSASAIFTARCGRHRRLADRICTDASDIGIYDLTVRERQNGQIRFALMRSGKLRYCISKVCGGALAGGIISLIGYAVFGLLMVIRFPSLNMLPVEEQEFYLMGSTLAAEAVKRLIGAFLYGMMGSLFGIGVAIAFRDKYMLICLPFMINYIYQQVLGKLASDCMVAEKYEKITWIEAMRTESIMNISGSVTWLIPFVVMLVIYVVLIGVFYLSMKIGEKQKQ
ncbi:MAG: hypothetical protein ACLUD0_04500 [Eubacterium ramulus]